ncbi:MAG: SH3 domain-containing protein [Gammaproteobacteria bacterium]|nr:SH3 domain-containing protein [Gammaproteobacteria bacterium]
MIRTFLLISMLSLVLLPAQAEDGVVIRTSTLYTKADSRSETLGSLSAGSTVNVFSRSGGWKEVFSKKQNLIGWVRSYQVREGLVKDDIKNESEDSRGFLAGLVSFSRRATGFFGGGGDSAGSSRTATIGVRGLSEEEIKAAKPDLQELKKLQSFSSSKSRMQTFATAGGLSPQKVKHIKQNK